MMIPETIDQLWIFGSHARGNSDDRSDVDILMVSDLDETAYVTSYFSKKYTKKIDVSYYSYEGLLPLINNGSLFAWHLKKEAIPLYQRSNRLKKLLTEMPDYSNHIGDLRMLNELVFDVTISLQTKNNSFIFDAGILGTVVRNAAIIMNNYLGEDDFSPWAPLKLRSLEHLLTMPLSDMEYEFLQKCRRLGERGGTVTNRIISDDRLLELTNGIGSWLRHCVNYVYQKEMV